jgi:hypothetical protein
MPKLCSQALGENPTNAQGNASDWTDHPKRRSSMTAQARTATGAPHVLRDVAEKSAAQAKEKLEKMSAAAGEANLLKHTSATTFKGPQDYSAKVLEFTNANINAAVEQATKLASVKSPTEFFALSNDYAKRQFEMLTWQAQRRNRPENDRHERPLAGLVLGFVSGGRCLMLARNARALGVRFPNSVVARKLKRSVAAVYLRASKLAVMLGGGRGKKRV